ncbi:MULTISPECIES: rhomboid family intramembrane serine protease [Oceanobacillus]|uniref:Rhomboid family intramembrane serine protease n=1 Tax=Oceanobacillus profundus TaxID=372463 RepID=A0A417YJS5_9BACI|nr:rhomboid family intramembrane serine protease [Oceanobacillus profundus]MCM3396764.1 rhomboid family intramembrane serine protease [Oceanobacillus profundus]RHW33187.1 rhomboid family intramembrane serine protease [Oceanobacillus profundus]
MYLDDQYKLYHMAYELVANQQFDILHIDHNTNEIWLEKYVNKRSNVIRLIQKGFDWKNHLKRDIAIVFQKAKAMKKLLAGKHIELYNVYISSHAPVDDWESLKKPMQLKEKNPIKMKVYYLDNEGSIEEFDRLQTDLDVQLRTIPENVDEEQQEQDIQNKKRYLTGVLENKHKEVEKVFSFGKPYFTYLLIAINLVLFILLELNGGSTSINTLIEMGAKYNPSIIEGEWWRIASSMFLHIGYLHLLMNMLAIYYLGTATERIFGRTRFLFIYFLAGIGGGLASFAFTTNVSAGASGAIFGLFGALLFFGIIYKRIFFQTMGSNILIILLINIVLGFSVEQIDMGAHIGGLLAGFLASAMMHLPNKKNVRTQLIGFIAYVMLITGLVIFGLNSNMNNQSNYLMQIEQLLLDNQFEEVVEVATEALDLEGDMQGPILFQRSYAYIELNELNLAVEDLEQSILHEPVLPEAYYNLALLYDSNGQIEEAKEMITKAYELNPDEESFAEVYKKITGESPE